MTAIRHTKNCMTVMSPCRLPTVSLPPLPSPRSCARLRAASRRGGTGGHKRRNRGVAAVAMRVFRREATHRILPRELDVKVLFVVAFHSPAMLLVRPHRVSTPPRTPAARSAGRAREGETHDRRLGPETQDRKRATGTTRPAARHGFRTRPWSLLWGSTPRRTSLDSRCLCCTVCWHR